MTEIRLSTEDDFQDVLLLLGQLWPDKAIDREAVWQVFHRALRSPSQTYLSAMAGSRVIGFCSLTVKNNLWQEGNLGHVDELVVDREFRGAGVGSALLDRIIEAARDAGCKRVELDSAFHRKAAHKFYEDRGFENRAFLFSRLL